MVQKEQTFDAQALTQEVVTEVVTAPFRLRTYRLLRKILIGFILVSIVNMLFSYFFYTPKMYRINRDNRELVIKYRIMQDRIATAQRKVSEIKHRDNYVYRSLFSTDTLSIEGIYTPYPETKYEAMNADNYALLMIDTWKQLDAFGRMLYLESVSFDDLQALSKNKEQLSIAIPSLWPIDRTRLKGRIGAFNPRRVHPVYHVIRPHTGIDLGGKTGDPIFATGDAVVEQIDQGVAHRGYGRQILLNHAFGYKTRYAHMSRIHVKAGDHVVRGQLIGEVGQTGVATGPHLHYEVIYRGKTVDPINYFDKNMTNDEYRKLVETMHDTDLEKFE
ncbi:MAG: M23 family metallopeptidase [Alistipes sp.]